jgi:transposase InsO family protein
VADAFSRLCDVSDREEHLTAVEEYGSSADYIQTLDTTVSDQALSESLNALDPSLIVIPRDVYNRISAVHNSNVGHLGVEKTLRKLLRQQYNQDYLREYIRAFIKQYPLCQKMSMIAPVIVTRPFTVSSSAPMANINLDYLYMSVEDETKDKYVLVVIDTFTRFVELYPCSSIDSKTVVFALLQHVGRYGVPASIQSDRGPEFVNEIIDEFVKIIGTEHVRTMQYSKEENAVVESCNREILRHVRGLVYQIGNGNTWSRYLPLVQRILISEVHDSISVSPAQLLYGNAINLDRGIFLPFEAAPKLNSLSKFTQEMLETQNKLLHESRKQQQAKRFAHLAKDRFQGEPTTQFPVNSFVLVQYPNNPITGKRGPSKLLTPLRGPLRIHEIIGNTYKLINLVNNKVETVNVTQLVPFYFDPEIHDPMHIAAKDYSELPIEQILTHRGDPARKSQMEFKVRWQGYTSLEDTWEPWKTLRNTPGLHAYLISAGLARLVPKEHR